MRISVAPLALRLVILSFSIDSQCKKATPEFSEGDTGGRGQKWLEESGYKKSEIKLKAAYIADYGGSHRQYFVIHSSEMNFEWIVIGLKYFTQYCYLNYSLNKG